MPPPLLLVHDDLATIASVRKALARIGRPVQLATSIADALSAFDNLAPEAVLLAPSVEGGGGSRFLAALRARPAGAVTPVLLLGEPIAGIDLPVVPLPLQAGLFLEVLDAALAVPEPEDLPLLDAGHMEELPPLVDQALAQAEADLEAEALAGLNLTAGTASSGSGAADEWPPPPRAPVARQPPAQAEVAGARRPAEEAGARVEAAEQARAAEEARARAEAAERARREAEEARARAEEELRAYQRAEAEERARRADAEARAKLEAEEARRLEAEARAAQAEVGAARAQAEAAQAAAREAQAQSTAEAELLASALREEAARRTRELAAQERLRSEAEARAEREARARAEAEARATAEVSRLAQEAREREEAERRARAEAEERAAREREALAQAERARQQAQALEVEASQLAERLAQGERAALDALGRAEEALRRERARADALRGELDAALAAQSKPAPPAGEAAAPAPPRSASAPSPRAPEAGLRRTAPAAPRPAPASAGLPPGARLEWGAADGGRVTLEQLAALVLRLGEVRATARLELRSGDTLRILWLSEGALVGAASTHPGESLLRQALADGLLDEPTAAGVRGLRLPDEALAAELVDRGALHEGEVLPLLQRLAETRALEALSERDSTYLLSADATPPTESFAPVRSLAALLGEALHRGLSLEEVEARVGGRRATPRWVRREEPDRFGFADREKRLLASVDGERTVGELLARAGLHQEEGFRTLAVAEVLGLLEVRAPEVEPVPEASAARELQRLDAKWAAASEADYFAVLGLSRSAGTEEVQRAHARLAQEFDPLRYAGHPDPDVPARAARLQTLLDEAAQALSDERLRQAYARALVDSDAGSRAT